MRFSRLLVSFLLTFGFLVLSSGSSFGESILIKGGTVLTVTGATFSPGDLLIENGRIKEVAREIPSPQGAQIIDAKGKFVTPGLVDTHSHIGVYSFPFLEANEDGNESTDPITPHVRAIDSINLEDPAILRALRGGVTTVQILPGSGNLIGGESAVIKLKPGATRLQDLLFLPAPRGMKMALGENPKRNYGKQQHRAPATRI